MTAPLIAPLIPPRARPGGRDPGRMAAPRRLPVAAAPEVPAMTWCTGSAGWTSGGGSPTGP